MKQHTEIRKEKFSKKAFLGDFEELKSLILKHFTEFEGSKFYRFSGTFTECWHSHLKLARGYLNLRFD